MGKHNFILDDAIVSVLSGAGGSTYKQTSSRAHRIRIPQVLLHGEVS